MRGMMCSMVREKTVATWAMVMSIIKTKDGLYLGIVFIHPELRCNWPVESVVENPCMRPVGVEG